MNNQLQPGWLDRQCKKAVEDMKSWPEWMNPRKTGDTMTFTDEEIEEFVAEFVTIYDACIDCDYSKSEAYDIAVMAVAETVAKPLLERIAELEQDAAHVAERIQWVLAACEIDRDARNELEGLL